jgi:hypothetical protein
MADPVESDSVVDAGRAFQRKREDQTKATFFQLFLGGAIETSMFCKRLLKWGLLEAVAKEAAVVVKKLFIGEIQSHMAQEAERAGFKERDPRDLTFCEFNEFIRFWIHRVYRSSLMGAMESTNEMISVFAGLGVDGTALKPIPAMLIETAFTEVASVLSSHSLKGASLEDFIIMFRLIRGFGRHPDTVVIDRELLKEKRMSLVWSSFQRFHGEYSARLKNALEAEEWRQSAPRQSHVGLLRRLSMSEITFLTLDGKTCEVSEPLLIFLEFTFQSLLIAIDMRRLSDELAAAVFEDIRSFAFGSSEGLLQRERTVSRPTLALSAEGLYFLMRFVPFIKSKFVSKGAQQARIELCGSNAARDLDASYNSVMKKIEDMSIDAVERTLDGRGVDANTGSNVATESSTKFRLSIAGPWAACRYSDTFGASIEFSLESAE